MQLGGELLLGGGGSEMVRTNQSAWVRALARMLAVLSQKVFSGGGFEDGAPWVSGSS